MKHRFKLFKDWFCSLTRAKQIVFSVLACHGLILCSLVIQHWISSVPPKRKAIAINTIRITAPPKQAVTSVKSSAQVIAPKKTTPQKIVAKPTPKAPVKPVPKPAAKPTPSPAKKAAVKVEAKKEVKPELKQSSKDLFKEIEESLAIVSAPTEKTKQAIDIPLTQESHILEFPDSAGDLQESSPAEVIAGFLHDTLQLPEFGEVKVLLILDSLGKLESLEVLEAKSEKNADFLRKQLPELLFPCLNKGITLTIVFSNEM